MLGVWLPQEQIEEYSWTYSYRILYDQPTDRIGPLWPPPRTEVQCCKSRALLAASSWTIRSRSQGRDDLVWDGRVLPHFKGAIDISSTQLIGWNKHWVRWERCKYHKNTCDPSPGVSNATIDESWLVPRARRCKCWFWDFSIKLLQDCV